METNVYSHYKNALAVQFGMAIAGSQTLFDAYDTGDQSFDVLLDKWVQEFDESGADNSWAFFEEKIKSWISEHSDGSVNIALSETSIHPGDKFYAVVFEKKLNGAHRFVTTKNLVIKELRCTMVHVIDLETSHILGYAQELGFPNYDVEETDCFTSVEAAEKALAARTEHQG